MHYQKTDFLERLDLVTNLGSWIIKREPNEKLKLHIKNAREVLDRSGTYDLCQIITVLDSFIPVFKECLLAYLKSPDLSYLELLSAISMINQSQKRVSDESYHHDGGDDDRHEVNSTLFPRQLLKSILIRGCRQQIHITDQIGALLDSMYN